jgi:phage-related protein
MMELVFSDAAKKELESLPWDLKIVFLKHLEKIQSMPPRRHMKHGIPCHVEEVTMQTRMIYDIKEERLYILHCFGNHKEYERWYKSYR